MRRAIKAAFGVIVVLVAVGLTIVVAFDVPLPWLGKSAEDNNGNSEELQKVIGAQPVVAGIDEAQAVELKALKEELFSVKRDLDYTRGLVEAMRGNNSALVQAVVGSKSADSSNKPAPIVVVSPDKGETKAPQPSFDSELFRTAVEGVVAEALLSFYFPGETSPRDELGLLKTAFEKAVERLFTDVKEPLAAGETLKTVFARRARLNELGRRVTQNEQGIERIAEALPKGEGGQYCRAAKQEDVVAVQKAANEVKASLEGLEKRLYNKDAVDTKVKEVHAAIEEVKTNIAAFDRICKNLGVAMATCVVGHDYKRERENTLGLLYLIFGDDFRIKDIKGARGYAKKLTLPYPPTE